MKKITVNGKTISVDVPSRMPLLWVLRDELGMVGTKFGCGISFCGACTVHVGGVPVRSCTLPVGSVNKPVTTIEGLGNPDDMHVVQQAWADAQVAQCGYCQSGQIMTAVALLARNKNPSDEQIDKAMTGNLCRCGTYPKIREAIKSAAKTLRGA